MLGEIRCVMWVRFLLLMVPALGQMSIGGTPMARRSSQRLTLRVGSVGNLTVGEGEDPAAAVEKFAAAATEAGHAVGVAAMEKMFNWFCERRRCGRPLTGAVFLNVTGAGSLTVAPFQEPAAMVETFASSASEAGVPFNVETMESMLRSLCASRSCHRPLAPPLTLALADVGNLTVMPYEDPPRSVERFAAAASAQGIAMNTETMASMLEWFCGKRSCRRPLAPPLTLALTDVGNLTVHPYQEPAYMVELFAARCTDARVPGFGVETAESMLAWFCERRSCFRGLAGPKTLAVTGVGNLTVDPTQDPATAVERFAAEANAAGHAVGPGAMADVYQWFCEKRSCFRPLAPPLVLGVDGVGNLTVQPHEDPPPRVEAFAAAAVAAGAAFDGQTYADMVNWFCARRSCHAPPTPPLALDVPDVGTIVAQPWEEPADAVEHFAGLATESGVPIGDDDMVKHLTWFCERRKCSRLMLTPPDRTGNATAPPDRGTEIAKLAPPLPPSPAVASA